jgi:hypothetical protein
MQGDEGFDTFLNFITLAYVQIFHYLRCGFIKDFGTSKFFFQKNLLKFLKDYIVLVISFGNP